MRIMLRSGPLLLALGVALTGCGQSGDSPPQGAAASGRTAARPADSVTPVSDSECVLSVAGMS
jgi:hypothetical protein